MKQAMAAAFKDNKTEIGTTENLLDGGANNFIGKKVRPMKVAFELPPLPTKKAENPVLGSSRLSKDGRRVAEALAVAAGLKPLSSGSQPSRESLTADNRQLCLFKQPFFFRWITFDSHSPIIATSVSQPQLFVCGVPPALPMPTLLLVTILEQPSLHSIRTLVLMGHRRGSSFSLPSRGRVQSSCRIPRSFSSTVASYAAPCRSHLRAEHEGTPLKVDRRPLPVSWDVGPFLSYVGLVDRIASLFYVRRRGQTQRAEGFTGPRGHDRLAGNVEG